MTTIKNFPLAKDLVPIDKLPLSFFKMDDDTFNLLEKIHFKDLYISEGKNKERGFYSLTLVLFKRLDLEINGTGGMKLVLNPSSLQTSNATDFSVNFHYKWDILRYKDTFNTLSFDDSPGQLFNLAFDILQIRKQDFFSNFLSKFFSVENGLQAFIEDFNINQPFELSLDPQILSVNDQFENIFSQFENNNTDLFQTLFSTYLKKESFEETLDNLNDLLKSIAGKLSLEKIRKFLKLSAELSLNDLSVALEFPRNYLVPVFTGTSDYPDAPQNFEIGKPLPDPFKTLLKFNIGSIVYNTESGLTFNKLGTFDFPKSFIGKSQFTLAVQGLELDLSKERNISAADADGRPSDFIGAYIKEGSIGFPADWGHNSPDIPPSTAELFVSNLLVGTGGISGTIGMRSTNPNDEDGLIQLKFGEKFKVSLSDFEIVFQQNAIISSSIHGKLEIPGFKNDAGEQVVIDIDIHIGQNGEFNIVAAAEPQIKKIRVPNAFDFDIKSAFFGREAGSDGRFYLGVSGMLDIHPPAPLGSLLPDKLDIKKMLIYDDGKFEFEGGKITLPKAYTVNFGAATVSVTGIHSGNYEKNGRDYKYFGFDGGISTKPSAVDAQGKGIKFYYSTDNGPFDWFIRLESLKVDIIIPGGSKPEDAAVTIKGFLSIGEPRIPEDALPEMVELMKSAQEYIGGVDVRIPKFRGLQASAAMRLTPKVPAFIIDLGLEMSTPILLGATGLGIYGFRALFGKRYVASKGAANIPDTGEWWQYYKAKISPDYKVGIQVSKFDIKEGFSVGAGVSLATASDSGKIFSSKLFFLLSLPDVFLFQGQAQFLKERISLDTNPDPPFFAIIAITNHSVEAGFGVNYKLRDDGKIVTVDGVIELGFFWGSSSSWYINVGRETPEDRRIQARLFDILNMYFYLMISSNGLRLGAGVKFEWAKKFGPLSAELKAYIDTFGKISKRPRQIGGAIKMGGTVGIKVCGLGFSVSGSATLAAEAPKPHMVTGEFEVCVKVLKKERCARFEFTWFFDDQLELVPTSLIGANVGESTDRDMNDVSNAARMTNMVTGETYPLKHTSSNPIPAPDSWITDGADNYRVPMDSFFDIEFKKGMNMTPAAGNNLGKIGGISTPAQYVEFVPPLRGKSDRVRHEYYLKNIEIFYWDEEADPAPAWVPYDFYNALLPMYENATGTLVDAIDADALNNMKWGYWQQQAPGLNNKLRILATTPISYTSTTGNAYNIEDLGINGNTILCPGKPIDRTCITFSSKEEQRTFAADTLNSYQNAIFRVTQTDGTVLTTDNNSYGLYFEPGSMLEVFFNEPMKDIRLDLRSEANELILNYYQRQEGPVVNNLSTYTYVLVGTTQHDPADGIIEYTQPDGAFDKIEVTMTGCRKPKMINVPVNDQAKILYEMHTFLNTLVSNEHLTNPSVELYDKHAKAYQSFFGSTLYQYLPMYNDKVMLTQGYVSNSGMSFTISDNKGYSCQYNFLLTQAVSGFTFDAITSVVSVVADPTTTLGEQQAMIVTFEVQDKNRGTYQITCRLTTCHVLSNVISSCSTGLYKLCYLSLENYLLNDTIPEEPEQTAANNAMFEAINKTLQPIWRPNTAYAIRLKTEDKLFREGQSNVEASLMNTDIYGFRTAGPVGHFHSYPVMEANVVKRQDRTDYHKLDEVGKQDEFRLSSLKSYIDYDKSYPNADGSLVNAKPLFYKDAELRLFYLYNYVYHFYNDWADYDHLLEPGVAKVAGSSLEIKVIDPAPVANPPQQQHPETSFDANMIVRNSSVGQPPVLINSVNNDISLLNNLLTGGNPCADNVPLTPIDISSVKHVDLKPLKLYTAQFVANYNARLNGALSSTAFSSVVHSYVFQTSRYGRFEEQVNSYILLKVGNVPVKKAIYPLELPVVPDYTLAAQVLSDTLTTGQDQMKQQYADTFDRLVQGVFALDANALQTAPTTEFNLLHSEDVLRGILIRNPEPFNNPKLPTAHATLEVRTFNGTAFANPEAFHVLHSADRASIFITPANMSFEIDPNARLEFRFKYKTYNGIQYQDAAEVNVEINLTNHPF